MAPVVIEEISVEQLRELEAAGIALSETGVERLRASESAAEDAERVAAEARAEAASDLEVIEADYLVARERVYAMLDPYVSAREAASALRVQYERAWSIAAKLDVAQTRIEPSTFPDEIRYRLQSLRDRW